MDIGLNNKFNIELDDRNDLPTLSERQEFEQRLALAVNGRYQDAIGQSTEKTILELIEVEAKRVARDFDVIDRVAYINVEPDNEQPNTINLTLTYETGETFGVSVTE